MDLDPRDPSPPGHTPLHSGELLRCCRRDRFRPEQGRYNVTAVTITEGRTGSQPPS